MWAQARSGHARLQFGVHRRQAISRMEELRCSTEDSHFDVEESEYSSGSFESPSDLSYSCLFSPFVLFQIFFCIIEGILACNFFSIFTLFDHVINTTSIFT